MSLVTVKGKFLDANLHKQNFDGNERISVQITIFVPDAPGTEKTITIKDDDPNNLDFYKKSFKPMDDFTARVSLNAYRNKVYYKMHDHSVNKAG